MAVYPNWSWLPGNSTDCIIIWLVLIAVGKRWCLMLIQITRNPHLKSVVKMESHQARIIRGYNPIVLRREIAKNGEGIRNIVCRQIFGCQGKGTMSDCDGVCVGVFRLWIIISEMFNVWFTFCLELIYFNVDVLLWELMKSDWNGCRMFSDEGSSGSALQVMYVPQI